MVSSYHIGKENTELHKLLDVAAFMTEYSYTWLGQDLEVFPCDYSLCNLCTHTHICSLTLAMLHIGTPSLFLAKANYGRVSAMWWPCPFSLWVPESPWALLSVTVLSPFGENLQVLSMPNLDSRKLNHGSHTLPNSALVWLQWGCPWSWSQCSLGGKLLLCLKIEFMKIPSGLITSFTLKLAIFREAHLFPVLFLSSLKLFI